MLHGLRGICPVLEGFVRVEARSMGKSNPVRSLAEMVVRVWVRLSVSCRVFLLKK